MIGQSSRDGARRPVRRPTLGSRAAAVGTLTAIWVLLWGDVSWANVVGGVLVSLFAVFVLPLPPLELHKRLRPLGVLRYVVRLIRDLIVSSVDVAKAALRPRGPLQNAVVAVPLRVVSDLNVALTSVTVTLIPGSVVIEARRETGTLYIHMLNVRDHHDLDRLRQSTLDVERRVVHAIGSDDEIRRVDEPRRIDGKARGGSGAPEGGSTHT
jgi:multicomponent Na+:H+ antiporter subunit E